MNEKVMLIDDDRSVLFAYQRQLFGKYDARAVESGVKALDLLQREGPFAVIVSDYRMPEMDGITLFTKAAEIEPDTVRILLTGYVDIEVALEAINKGNIFRFLSKPASAEDLLQAIEAGVKQYRLVTSERELLKKTVTGSVKVLADIFSLINPTAFGQAVRIGRLAKTIAWRLALEKPWEIELAAILSQIGCVAVPAHILEKKYSGQALSSEEMKVFQSHPELGKKLLYNIPRLEAVARGMEYQFNNYDGTGLPADKVKGIAIPFIARLLKVVLDFDCLTGAGNDTHRSIELMQNTRELYDPGILAALEAEVMSAEEGYIVKSITVEDVKTGMLLADDIKDDKGTILAPRGHSITELLKTRLSNFARFGTIQEPIKILEKVKGGDYTSRKEP